MRTQSFTTKFAIPALFGALCITSSANAADLPIASEKGDKGKVEITVRIPNEATNRPPAPTGMGINVLRPDGSGASVSVGQDQMGGMDVRVGGRVEF